MTVHGMNKSGQLSLGNRAYNHSLYKDL